MPNILETACVGRDGREGAWGRVGKVYDQARGGSQVGGQPVPSGSAQKHLKLKTKQGAAQFPSQCLPESFLSCSSSAKHFPNSLPHPSPTLPAEFPRALQHSLKLFPFHSTPPPASPRHSPLHLKKGSLKHLLPTAKNLNLGLDLVRMTDRQPPWVSRCLHLSPSTALA